MRTVHETEALRPSDPVPKHHSSNPSNNKQRIKLILNSDGKKPEKGSTPGSPSSHSHPPNSATVPPASDGDYAHNNVTYLQDLSAPGAPTLVQFPPDIEFTERELSLPAPELFQLLRRQLQWAQQDSEQLRAEADVLEKLRKEEWEAKELLVENVMEAQVANERRQRADRGEPEDFEGFDAVEYDTVPSKALPIRPLDGKLPWWREERPPYPQAHPDIRQSHETEHEARPPPADIRRDGPRSDTLAA
tara:strand:- start:2593 stop:3333 length:741 start_codon:yes stop_codon:yes gene_type:complete